MRYDKSVSMDMQDVDLQKKGQSILPVDIASGLDLRHLGWNFGCFEPHAQILRGIDSRAFIYRQRNSMNQPDVPSGSDPSEELVRLIAQAQRRLYAFVLTLVRRPSDADDVLQETNVVLWRKREAYQSGTDFFAWAFQIARLQVLAHRARTERQGKPFDDAVLDALAQQAEAESKHYDQREAALRDCLRKLPVDLRTIIVRRYQLDVTVNSLAEELGKTAKAVSESLRRIRLALRQCIERTLSAERHS